jgi:Mrp family chromosome partitioning ATPase
MSRNFDLLQREVAGPKPFPQSEKPGPQKMEPRGRRDRHMVAEDEVMKLVQQVFVLPGKGQAPEAVAFCGVYSGDGCSWVCAHAAEMLAEHGGGSVCIVDANLRTPSLHDYFRFENGKGFADGIAGNQPLRDYARRASGHHLWLITAGTVGREPNGSLNPARLRTRLTELRGEFDHVLIDTPAVHTYGDAILLGQLADGIVLVVGSNSTRREPARIAKESFEAAKIPILGAVLNKRTFPIPEALYRKL